MHGGYGIFGGMGFFGLLMVILFIYILVKIFQTNKKGYKQSESDQNQAMDILNQRYAAGEIDEEEYKKRKSVLKD